MATYNLSITSDADDGFELEGSDWLDRNEPGYSSGEWFAVLQTGSPANNRIGALRFPATGIPQGSTISSATLTINIAVATSADPANAVLLVTGDDVDDSPALSSTHRPSLGWTDTTATGTANNLAVGPVAINVTSVVQEIVNRPGFSGGAIAFKLGHTGSDTYWDLNVVDYDPNTLASVATLVVTTPDGGGSSTTVTPAPATITPAGLAPIINDFTNVRYQEVLINGAGSPMSNLTDLHFTVWYSGQCSGAPDLSYSDLTTGPAGTASYSLASGSLVFGQKVFGVITDDGASLSTFTCGLLTLNYSS